MSVNDIDYWLEERAEAIAHENWEYLEFIDGKITALYAIETHVTKSYKGS